MSNSLADQLEPLRRRIVGSGLKIHAVLAIEAELTAEDQAGAVEMARKQTLRSMNSELRVGKLPERAWAFETFEHMPGGNQAFAVRFKGKGSTTGSPVATCLP